MELYLSEGEDYILLFPEEQNYKAVFMEPTNTVFLMGS